MKKTSQSNLTVFFLLFGLYSGFLFFTQPALAQDVLDIRQHVAMKELGDCFIKADFKWSPEMYEAIKARFPTPELFVTRFLTPDKFEAEPRNIKAIYDDKFYRIHVEMDVLGMARNQGTYWSLEIGDEDETVKLLDINNSKAVFESVESDIDLITRIETTVLLPAGASNTQFDNDTKHITYALPEKEYNGKHVNIKCIVRRKKRLMASIYKLYSNEHFFNLWVTKVLFTNNGDVPLKDFKVKFSLGNYSDGYGEIHETPLFLPGQNIVQVYRPILGYLCSQINSNTPVKLKVFYSYKLPSGETKEKEIIKRIEILGRKDFVFSDLQQSEIQSFADMFSNADYITAWVTSYDPVVCEFGGMANELAGGAGAAVDDDSAILVSAAIYELMRYNKVTYQSPAGLFNSTNIQHLKYPRNTLRDKSGTCIDLAIAFSAFAEAQGCNPVLILIPGHCFPGVILPQSGNILPIEMTLLGGGTKTSSQAFDKAVEVGNKELAEAVAKGDILFINIGELKKKGVTPPDLPTLPSDIIQRWNIKKIPDTQQTEATHEQAKAQWVQWKHPGGHYAVTCPDSFQYAQPDEFTVNLISPDESFYLQVIMLPSNLQGIPINEEKMVEIFATSKGELVPEKSTLSDPKAITLKNGTSGISREFSLVFKDGSSLYAYGTFFDAGKIRFFMAGCFADQSAVESYGNFFLSMAESVQFAYKISGSSTSVSGGNSATQENDSLEGSLEDLGKAFDELINSLSQ